MIYFGQPWNAPAVDDGVAGPTPVGEPCQHCGEPIAEGDQGFMINTVRLAEDGRTPVGSIEPTHRECLIRLTVGSVECLQGRCQCATGAPGGPQDTRSLREQGRQTIQWLRSCGGAACQQAGADDSPVAPG